MMVIHLKKQFHFVLATVALSDEEKPKPIRLLMDCTVGVDAHWY
jgi:hypothetical protein